jgi:hypothetical protein
MVQRGKTRQQKLLLEGERRWTTGPKGSSTTAQARHPKVPRELSADPQDAVAFTSKFLANKEGGGNNAERGPVLSASH